MLQVIVSPAKKMVANRDAFEPHGVPPFADKTAALLDRLHGMSRSELKALWKTSDKLTDAACAQLSALEAIPLRAADLGHPRFAAATGPAILSYVGIQYQSMAPAVMDERALAWLQEHLWILSGFYGCVRPFDAVAPYRLEMGARLAMPADEGSGRQASGDLYGYWGADLARAVCTGEETCVVNLASVEYAKAVLPHLPANAHAVTCVFGEELKQGKPVQRATASKIARGSMVRWMAEGSVEDPEQLCRFDIGYRHAPELDRLDARGNRTLVFLKS